jgi:hypothetical protein
MRDALTAQLGDEIRSLLDGLRAVGVIRTAGSRRAAPTGTDDRRAGFSQRCGNTATRPAGGSCDDGYPTPQRIPIQRPAHSPILPDEIRAVFGGATIDHGLGESAVYAAMVSNLATKVHS